MVRFGLAGGWAILSPIVTAHNRDHAVWAARAALVLRHPQWRDQDLADASAVEL
jgi:hypothetical protein